MLNNINIRCEDGQIRLTWKWESELPQRMDIYYKKQGSPDGEGTPFISGGINKIPYMENGQAARKLGGEKGIYIFTFLPKDSDGNILERIVVEQVMLGTPVEVLWQRETGRDGEAIVFHIPEETLPENIVLLKLGNSKYEISTPLENGGRLLFPQGFPENELSLYIKKPYDRVYRLRKG